MLEGCPGVQNVRHGKVMRFVSESLPRLISEADGSDPLPQTLVFITTREAGRSPILAVFRALLA